MEGITPVILQKQERFTKYQTYEQLRDHTRQIQDTYPHLARTELAGYGADITPEYPRGRPIEALIIGDQQDPTRPYAMVQFEHENELPATLLQPLLAEVVCENPDLLDELGFNLILLNTTHPDGIALQRWVSKNGGEFNPLQYALWFYRSRPDEQISWGYPFYYKTARFNTPSPEVLASIWLMQKYKPTFFHSAHAAPINDPYFYLSHPDAQLMDQIEDIVASQGFMLLSGEADAPYVKKIRYGFFHPPPNGKASYNYREQHTTGEVQWSGGTTATDYLRCVTKNPHTLLSEVPFMSAEALQDESFVDLTRREAGEARVAIRRQIMGRVAHYFAYLEPLGANNNSPQIARLLRSTKWWYADFMPKKLQVETNALQAPCYNMQATRAETFAAVQYWQFHSSLYLGQIHHAARLLGHHGLADDVHDEIAQQIESIRAVSPLQINSLPKLVGLQALTAVAAMRHAKARK